MFTKQDLHLMYKKDTGDNALVDGRKTTEYVEWMENQLEGLYRVLDEMNSDVADIDLQVKNILGDE